jgi:hypothetical protein
MLRRGLSLLAALAMGASGCGEGERQATPATTSTPEATPTPTPTSTATQEALTRARSLRQCARLWNEEALPGENFQVTANGFVAELAPVRVRVAYARGDCFVVAPIGRRRIAIFTAANGRRPFTVPTRRTLKAGERVDYNARADRDGRVVLRR